MAIQDGAVSILRLYIQMLMFPLTPSFVMCAVACVIALLVAVRYSHLEVVDATEHQ